MKLQHNKPNEGYAEECQERPCRFYWGVVRNGQLETDHGPVLCRDFLGDTLVWKAGETAHSSIYGWKYDGKIEKDFTSIVLDNFGSIEDNVKTILNPIEEKIGVTPTTVERTDDGNHVWVKSDKFWMTTTVHFSWLTTLLRYLTYSQKFKDFDEMVGYPTNYWMKEAFPKFKKLPYVLKDMKVTQVSGCKNVKQNGGHTMHNYNGWYSNTSSGYESKFTEYAGQLNGLLA